MKTQRVKPGEGLKVGVHVIHAWDEEEARRLGVGHIEKRLSDGRFQVRWFGGRKPVTGLHKEEYLQAVYFPRSGKIPVVEKKRDPLPNCWVVVFKRGNRSLGSYHVRGKTGEPDTNTRHIAEAAYFFTEEAALNEAKKVRGDVLPVYEDPRPPVFGTAAIRRHYHDLLEKAFELTLRSESRDTFLGRFVDAVMLEKGRSR